MKNDFIITVAWPEGLCEPAGSWYDYFATKNGKYRVGHSATILINSKTKKAHYFDFGRYHTPKGYGRVRDVETDGDLAMIDVEIQNGEMANLEAVLLHLSAMKATHGEGKMYASVIMNVSFDGAFSTAKNIQEKGMLPYGPFIRKGTNCSRFVAEVIQSSGVSFIKKIRFQYPFCISPSPKRNVCIANHHYYIVENNNCVKVKKSKLRAYFSSIEQ
ncbi:MAG: DUF6695 family protein [Bacteroidota bacterium]|nr:DUF6695 family protein [Bacteroidota bacterium]